MHNKISFLTIFIEWRFKLDFIFNVRFKSNLKAQLSTDK